MSLTNLNISLLNVILVHSPGSNNAHSTLNEISCKSISLENTFYHPLVKIEILQQATGNSMHWKSQYNQLACNNDKEQEKIAKNNTHCEKIKHFSYGKTIQVATLKLSVISIKNIS